MSKSKLRRLEVQYKARIEELEEENNRLKTYAQKLERNISVLDVHNLRKALGLNRIMMEWIIPPEHNKAIKRESNVRT